MDERDEFVDKVIIIFEHLQLIPIFLIGSLIGCFIGLGNAVMMAIVMCMVIFTYYIINGMNS